MAAPFALAVSTERPIVTDALRWLHPPFMLLGVNGAAITLTAAGASHALLAPLLLAAVAVSFAVERAIPYQAEWNEPHDDVGRDLAHAIVNETFTLLSVLALPAIASIATAWPAWPDQLPFVVQVVLAIVVFDFGITIAHWLSHRWAPLWRLHAVHHSVKRCYGFNGLMKHPLHQAIELTFGIAPLLVIGITQKVAWALAFTVAIQLLMQHSNADYQVGRLRYVLSLNEGHRFHHLKWAGVGDVNFGLFTLVYDHLLLRTFSYDPAKRFSSDDLGIAKEPDFFTRYSDQLFKPFRAKSRALTVQRAKRPRVDADRLRPSQICIRVETVAAARGAEHTALRQATSRSHDRLNRRRTSHVRQRPLARAPGHDASDCFASATG